MTPHILTSDGTYFNFLNPEESEYSINCIAFALSHIARYTGHTRVPYYVSDHSVRCSYLVPKTHALDALMHDAAEAFLGDVSSPLKQLLPDYKVIEQRVEKAIAAKFGLRHPMDPCVKRADWIMLCSEKRDLMPATDVEWSLPDGIKPIKERIWPLKNREAREAFLSRFYELTENK